MGPCLVRALHGRLHRHLLPGYRLGYGPDSLVLVYERICSLCIMRRTSPEAPLKLPAVRKGDSGRSSVLPLPPQALTPPSTPSGAKPPRAMAAHVGARSWSHTIQVSAEPPVLAMSALAPDAMAAFMSEVIQDE